MQSSEEVNQINSALSHCSQLKTQLQGTILRIQKLNTKYNQTDYMAVIRNLENYRRSSNVTSSPYPKIQRQRDHPADESNNDKLYCSTPLKRSKVFRRLQTNMNQTSTPKSRRFNDSFDSCQSDVDTPRRSVHEMKKSNNTVSVRTIKLQRNIEAIITRLQVIQKSHKKRQQRQMEQSLYQSCCNSSIGSPGLLGYSTSIDSSFGSFVTAFGSNDSLHNHSNYHSPNKFTRHDEDKKTLERVQRFYATPLQRMHKRLTYLNASLIRTC